MLPLTMPLTILPGSTTFRALWFLPWLLQHCQWQLLKQTNKQIHSAGPLLTQMIHWKERNPNWVFRCQEDQSRRRLRYKMRTKWCQSAGLEKHFKWWWLVGLGPSFQCCLLALQLKVFLWKILRLRNTPTEFLAQNYFSKNTGKPFWCFEKKEVLWAAHIFRLLSYLNWFQG